MFAPGLVKLQKRCTRLAAATDNVYQLLAHGRWFSLGTPAAPTTKTGRHDIAEILLEVALKLQKSNQSTTLVTISISVTAVHQPPAHRLFEVYDKHILHDFLNIIHP